MRCPLDISFVTVRMRPPLLRSQRMKGCLSAARRIREGTSCIYVYTRFGKQRFHTFSVTIITSSCQRTPTIGGTHRCIRPVSKQICDTLELPVSACDDQGRYAVLSAVSIAVHRHPPFLDEQFQSPQLAAPGGAPDIKTRCMLR